MSVRITEEIDGQKFEVLDSRVASNSLYIHKSPAVNISGHRGIMYFSAQAYEDLQVEEGKRLQFFVFGETVLLQVNDDPQGIHCTIEKKSDWHRKSFKVTSAIISRQLLLLAGMTETASITCMMFETKKELRGRPLWELNLKAPLKILPDGDRKASK